VKEPVKEPYSTASLKETSSSTPSSLKKANWMNAVTSPKPKRSLSLIFDSQGDWRVIYTFSLLPTAEPLLLNRFVTQLKEGHTTPAELKEFLEAKLMAVDEVS